MERGYIKLHRKIVDSRVFQNEGLLKVWIWCLVKASHLGRWVKVKAGRGITEVYLEPGQFIFGRNSSAKDLNMKPEAARRRIEKLEKLGCIELGRTSKYSLISVINWHSYQVTHDPSGPSKDHLKSKNWTNQSPSLTCRNHRGFQDKEGVDRTSEKIKVSPQTRMYNNTYSCNSEEYQLSSLLLDLILERRNSFKKPDLQKWAKEIDLMIQSDGRTPGEIQQLIEWCQQDAFWQNNILSPRKLRKQFDQLALKMGQQIPSEPEPSYYRRLDS